MNEPDHRPSFFVVQWMNGQNTEYPLSGNVVVFEYLGSWANCRIYRTVEVIQKQNKYRLGEGREEDKLKSSKICFGAF